MKKLSYLNHIDSLRAVAVLLVIFFHLEIELFKGGFIGVDVFFVISGFLITRILNHEFVETGKINFKKFYTRRIRRLMPTLFLTILLTFIFTFLAFSPSDFMNATRSMFMSSIALSNFHFLSIADYFDTTSNFKPLLHTWSLGIEEQFYLLYPISLFFLLKLFPTKKKSVTIGLSLLFFLSLLLTIYSSKYGLPESITSLFLPKDDISSGISSMQFYLLPFRMFEFLVGAIIALLPSPKIKSEYLKLGLNILGFAIILIFGIMMSKHTPYLSTLNLIPCLGVGMLLFFPPTKHLSFFYDNKFLKYTGKISYTLYLIHWPVIVIYRYLFDDAFSFIEQIGLVTVTYLLSFVIYEYYENPLRYKTAKFAIKSNTSLVLGLIICILSVFIIKQKVNYEEGWLWRLSDENIELVKKIGFPKDFHKNNWGGVGYKEGWLGKKRKKKAVPDLIWLGDSHAGHYLTGLDSVMVKKRNKKIYVPNWYSSLKLPDIVVRLSEERKRMSKERFAKDSKFIMKHPNSPVVLSHAWTSQMSRSNVFNHTSNKYEEIGKDSAGWKLLAEKIVEFHEMSGPKRKFIIIGETPTIVNSKLNYIEKLLRPKYLSGFAPVTSEFPNNKIEFNSFFENYFSSMENIIFIDPSKAFCKDGTCIKQKNNQIYYSDGGHISRIGSLKAMEYMEEILANIIKKDRKK